MARTRARPLCRAARSVAKGSSAGPLADHQRCVQATTPEAVVTSVVMSCGGVARRLDQADRGGDGEALGGAVIPDVTLVDRPVIVEARVGEERGVKRVIGVMVREDHVGDGIGRDAERGQRIEDRRRDPAPCRDR